jgi:hypothetical protein
MLKKTRFISISLTLLLAATALSACTDTKKIKEEAQQAINKQSEMKAYNFEGSADLKLGDGLIASANPLTMNILSLLKESTLEWNGAVTTDPAQYQANMKLTPKGAAAGIEIPILLKDSKLYFHIPAISKADEYYAVDLVQLSKSSKNPLSSDNLKNTTQVSTAITSLFFGNIDAKWYKKEKEPLKLPNGSNASIITLQITDKNEKEISKLFQDKWPQIVDILVSSGLITQEQADKQKAAGIAGITIKAPGKLQIAIDETGFIRDESFDINLQTQGKDGKLTNNQITLHQLYNEINGNVKIDAQVPKNVKPFEDILKFLKK